MTSLYANISREQGFIRLCNIKHFFWVRLLQFTIYGITHLLNSFTPRTSFVILSSVWYTILKMYWVNLQMKENCFNPVTPMSDRDGISSYNVNTISSRQVMRIKKNIIEGIINWSNTRFSDLTSSEFYRKESYWWDLGSERVK